MVSKAYILINTTVLIAATEKPYNILTSIEIYPDPDNLYTI